MLDALDTPALLLDLGRLDANLARMRARIALHDDVAFRPHLKTAKSVDVARRAFSGDIGPITVSTLREAEVFHAAGFNDILYAVGIVPAKLARATALRRAGCDLTVILDSQAAAEAVVAHASKTRLAVPALIEIDTDGQRGGLTPDDPALLSIGRALAAAGLLRGVMTHAGGSYSARSVADIVAVAERERAGVVCAADRLRADGLPCGQVSVGSTPTALFAEDLSGVTEVRAGVYMFGDLVMSGLGVMAQDEIALSVLTRVIGHRPDRGWILVDAGWMAMSRDRGTSIHPIDQGYGVVLGKPGDDLIMVSANQEHGIIARRDGGTLDPADYPLDSLLRVLPNHACATAAQHGHYVLVQDGGVVGRWDRFNDW